MERQEFLARLRPGAPENLPHPMPSVDGVPELRYTVDLSDPVTTFAAKASAVGAQVRRGDPLEELLSGREIRRAVCSNDPECIHVGERLAAAGVEVVPLGHGRELADCDLGVTGAAWGVAATGTLVMRSDRAGGRSASLVPPVHLALVRSENVLPTAADLFRRVRGDLPSQLVLVTGPSRSADIELTLTVGVHGPRELWIGILDG